MSKKQGDLLNRTIEHFKKIARDNRFAENAMIPHDPGECLICHPEKSEKDPFMIYVEVIAQCIPERRPRLDDDLVAAINEDLALYGHSENVTLEALQARTQKAMDAWRFWLTHALDTGLELLSVHSPTSLEFSLEDAAGSDERRAFVESKLDELTRKILGT